MDELDGLLEVNAGALLRTHLYHSLVFARRFHHALSFLHDAADGLFHVNVLAGLRGFHGEKRVPVVRRGHNHGVDVLAIENPPKVLVGFRLAARGLRGCVQVRLVDVAHGGNLGVGLLGKIFQVPHAHPAGANHANPDPVVGASRPRWRTGHRQAGPGHGGALDEIATIDCRRHGSCPPFVSAVMLSEKSPLELPRRNPDYQTLIIIEC